MKTTLLLLIFAVSFFINTQAQSQKAGFHVSIPDASSKSVFDQNPDLNNIYIMYRNGEAATIDFYCHDGKGGTKLIERYYTSFEGDCYILSKNYPGLKIPQAPKLDVGYFNNIQYLRDSTVRYTVTTKLKRDTLIHNFSYFILSKGVYWYEDLGQNYKPRMKANHTQFEKKLMAFYKQWKPIAVADSVLIITGVVEKDGSFGDIKLQIGKSSPFSDKVLEFIAREATSWWPGVMTRSKKVRDQTKIFVRLNHDDSITFSTL